MAVPATLSDAGLAGKVALVTGASSGIGQATAQRLEAFGAQVVRLDRAAQHAPPWAFAHDVSHTGDIRNMLTEIENSVGPIELLVHAAAMLEPGPLLEYSLDQWQQTFAVNTLGAFYLCQQVGRAMAVRGRGAMVAVGSNCAAVPRLQIGAYAASKAATQQMLRCLGLELAAAGVRCNIVAPGSTDTPMQRMLCPNAAGIESVIAGTPEAFRLGIPLKKLATPDDIAAAICFLLSDQAGHITLETLTVDGGATLGCG